MDITKLIKDEYLIEKGDEVVIDGALAKGGAVVTEISWDEPLRSLEGDSNNGFQPRPFPPHIRVKMKGATVVGEKAKIFDRTFLYHGEDLINGLIRKPTPIDFI